VTAFIIVLWALLGFAVGTLLFGEMAPLFGIRNMEGNAAYFGVLIGGPIGAVAGVTAALMLRRTLGDDCKKRRIVALASLAVLIGIPLAIWAVESWRTHDHLTARPNTWGLGYQVRTPAGELSPADQKIGIELRSAKENPKCSVHEFPHGLTQQADRFVISGNCPLFYATPQRRLLVRIGDKPTLIFNVRVKARPEAATYSDWFPVDAIYDNADGQTRSPRPDEKYEIRYGAR
jgi:hypothetical protein